MDTAQEQAVVAASPKGLFIGGQWREATGGKSFGVVDPSTEETLCEVADGTAADARAALDAAADAHGSAARSCVARSRLSTSGSTTWPCS
jgi:succinate-semialdehyde dehydrogenase/glutarate-semialdehyde dehydrogenase